MNWITPTIIFLLFCVSHSYLAEASVKEEIFERFPCIQPFYRILYSLLSVLLLALWFWYIPNESTLVYSVSGFFKGLILSVKFISIIFLIYALLKFNLGVFVGTRQVKDFLKHKKKPEYLDEPQKGELITTGVQKYVRHPLYTFSILVLITNPSPTITEAYLSICLILYFWIGSYFEEKKLVQRFGEEYKRYQAKTGRLFPKLKQ
jgi:protein-S-isoprenylcysteine O-methyltransferase Ste14